MEIDVTGDRRLCQQLSNVGVGGQVASQFMPLVPQVHVPCVGLCPVMTLNVILFIHFDCLNAVMADPISVLDDGVKTPFLGTVVLNE